MTGTSDGDARGGVRKNGRVTSTPDPLERPDPDALRRVEEALEPVALIQQSGAIMRMGRMMLAAGTASYRVKQAMTAVASALGVDRHSHQVSFTEIVTTTHRGKIFRTEVGANRAFGVNSDRIWALDRLRQNLPDDLTAPQLHRELDAIQDRPRFYSVAATASFAGAACAAFAVLNGADWIEAAIVFIAAFLGQLTRHTLHKHAFNLFGTVLVSAAVASLVYLAGIAALGLVGNSIGVYTAGYISTVLFLLPGFPLVTGALDMAKMDIASGVERIAFGTTLTIAAGISVVAVSLISDLDDYAHAAQSVPLPGQIAVWAVASFVGVYGFASIFNSPWHMAASAATVGMVANTFRLTAIHEWEWSLQAATLTACVIVGVLAAAAVAWRGYPIITLNVPAVLVMVPGVTAHQTVVDLNEGHYTDAVTGLLQVVMVVLAIMVGLVIAKLVTDRDWSHDRPSSTIKA